MKCHPIPTESVWLDMCHAHEKGSNRSVWPDANCPGTASDSTIFYFTPWTCSGLNLPDRMLLTETTVDAEVAEHVDGAKMLVDGIGDLGVNDAVMVVETTDRLIGGHEGLDGLVELRLESINLLNCGSSQGHFMFESLNDFLCVFGLELRGGTLGCS